MFLCVYIYCTQFYCPSYCTQFYWQLSERWSFICAEFFVRQLSEICIRHPLFSIYEFALSLGFVCISDFWLWLLLCLPCLQFLPALLYFCSSAFCFDYCLFFWLLSCLACWNCTSLITWLLTLIWIKTTFSACSLFASGSLPRHNFMFWPP